MEIPRHWRLKKQRYGLIGEICPHCSYKIFPPRDVCPNCGEEAKDPYLFSGKGEVFSYTILQDGPAGFENTAPYTVAIIKLEEGPMACPSKWSPAGFARMETNEVCLCTGISLDQ